MAEPLNLVIHPVKQVLAVVVVQAQLVEMEVLKPEGMVATAQLRLFPEAALLMLAGVVVVL